MRAIPPLILLLGLFLAAIQSAGGQTAATQAESYRQVAMDAGKWIRSTAIKSEKGTAWPAIPGNPKSVGTGLYNGVAGIVLYFLEAHAATKDESYLQDARAGADYLLNLLEDEKETGLYETAKAKGFVK